LQAWREGLFFCQTRGQVAVLGAKILAHDPLFLGGKDRLAIVDIDLKINPDIVLMLFFVIAVAFTGKGRAGHGRERKGQSQG